MDDQANNNNQENQPEADILRLSPETAKAVDHLLENGGGMDSTSSDDPELQKQSDAVKAVLGLLDHYPVEDASEELLDATLARIDRHEDELQTRMKLASVDQPRSSSRWRMPDFIATAAAMFLAVGIGLPVYQSIQHNNKMGQSQARLGGIGTAIAGFSTDNSGMMPLDKLALETPFDPINTPHSNHLNVLAHHGHLEQDHLKFAGDTGPGTSFSYRVPFDPQAFRLQHIGADSPIAGDRNPIIWRIRTQKSPSGHLEGSPTHEGRGQVVLMGDLSTPWHIVPVVNLDQIWTTQDCPDSAIPICPPRHRQDVILVD